MQLHKQNIPGRRERWAEELQSADNDDKDQNLVWI